MGIFNNSALANSTVFQFFIALAASLLMGLLIYFVYSRFYRGVVYNRSFAITLAGMSVLTAMVTLAISKNVVISLGMVGALSIVRYRTAIKEPLDLLYIFWSITTGITIGATMYGLALVSAGIMIIMIICFNARSSRGNVYILVIHCKGEIATDSIMKAMGSSKFRVKSKTYRGETSEMALEVFCKTNNLAFLEKLRALDRVVDLTLIQYDGEYHG